VPPYPRTFLTEADAQLTLHQNKEIARCKACTSLPRISVQNSKTVKGSIGPFKFQIFKKHDKLFQHKKKASMPIVYCQLQISLPWQHIRKKLIKKCFWGNFSMCLIYYTWMLILHAFHSIFWFKTNLWKWQHFRMSSSMWMNICHSHMHTHSHACAHTYTQSMHARIRTCPHACTSNDSRRFQIVGHSNINPQNKICHTQV